MKLVLVLLLLSGCAGTKWEQFNYGPGDWLAENTGLEVDSPYSYHHYYDPVITVHVVDNMRAACGDSEALGCARGTAQECDIYVGERSSESTLTHEYRHCHGWSHATSGAFSPWYR